VIEDISLFDDPDVLEYIGQLPVGGRAASTPTTRERCAFLRLVTPGTKAGSSTDGTAGRDGVRHGEMA
jgi:hypothetical protein